MRREGSLVTCDHSRSDGGAAQAAEVWLAPGRYMLRTRDREPVTELAFTVGTTEGPPLRVPVR